MSLLTRTAMKSHNAPGGRQHGVAFRWGQVAITILLILIGALCLMKYLGWAGVVSGLYGLPSQAHTVATAQHWSFVYFWVGLLAEAVLIVNLAVRLKLDAIDLDGALKLVARGIAALTIAGAGTLGVAFLLSWVGKLLR
jgi:hypothetical protein